VVMLHHIIYPLDRQQLRFGSGIARLATAHAATALAPLRRLEPVAGGRLGGVTGAAADPLPQAGQLGRQGGELVSQLLVFLPECLNLLLLSLALRGQLKTSSPHADRSSGPVRFCYPSRWGAITSSLCLRCSRDSRFSQGFSRVDVRCKPSRPRNG
jgi:hypothetical protein